MVSLQANLVGMDAELRGDLGDRFPLGRFKSHLGLEGRVVRLPHTRKHTIPPYKDMAGSKIRLRHLSSYWIVDQSWTTGGGVIFRLFSMLPCSGVSSVR